MLCSILYSSKLNIKHSNNQRLIAHFFVGVRSEGVSDDGLVQLQRFDVSRVLQQGASLLASEGDQFLSSHGVAGTSMLS